MAHTKRRVIQHIMEDQSDVLVRAILPRQWVVRRYSPDYGIDCQVEIFEYVDAQRKKADTLGEMFFVQLKSIETTKIETIEVEERVNVEKPASFDSGGAKDRHWIEVVKFQIDTNELMTVEAMGAGLPVVLFVVALDTERVFFVCLNDYIDKVLLPDDPDYKSQGTKVLNVPVRNELTDDEASLTALRQYAKRAKLLAAFSRFAYQDHELRQHLEECGRTSEATRKRLGDRGLALIRHFVAATKRLMIWSNEPFWAPLNSARKSLDALDGKLAGVAELTDELAREVQEVWRQHALLGRMYEEACREWFLPTYTALVFS